MKTIPQKFKETAEKFSSRNALKFKFQGAYIGITFGELAKRVDHLAKGLKTLNVVKGDRVAILSENRTEWIRSDLAILTLGAVTVPVHTTLSPQIISHILNDSGAKVIIVSNQEQFNKLFTIINDLPSLEVIVYIDLNQSLTDLPKKLVSLDELMKIGEQDQAEIKDEVNPDDLASIVYTSGTTALPKGVMLTHNNFMFDAAAAVAAVPASEKDVLLSFLPLSHVLERTAGYYAPFVCCGACIAFAESMKTLKENLVEVKPTIIISVPRIFEKVHRGIWDKVKQAGGKKRKIFIWALKQEPGTFKYRLADMLVFKKVRKSFGGRLRFTISGGATLNHKLARFFNRMGIIILEGYGLTETSPSITVNRLDRVKFGTVGQQLPGVELKIAPDKEIITRGPNLMKGYYNNEELTRQVIDEDGWFHTGDLGFINNEGYLIIIGRKKEMISLSNGKIVWPEQIELMLNNDRFISQSMVYGDNKNFISALIVPDWQEITRNLAELKLTTKEPEEFIKDEKLVKLIGERLAKINQQFADWEQIKKFILLPREFSQEKDELTPTMKLRRKKIEETHYKNLQNLYN